jgi:N-acetylglucosamine-6-phosphate deacetylase
MARSGRLGVEAALVDGGLVQGDVQIADGRIAEIGLSSANGRGVAAPGFIDLQVNGYAGVDFFSADDGGYRNAGEGLLAAGVTAYQPTFITSPEQELTAALREVPRNGPAPRILGAHLEGPFIAPGRLGMHPPEARRDPDCDLLQRLLEAGPVSHVTLAPELPGAYELIELLQARGVTVSLGHSDATAAEARQAFSQGVRTVTHIFNAMRPFAAREPGLAGAALVSGDVVVQVILDGVHLADDTARLVWQAASGRVAIVSDAIAAAGAGDGSYRLAGVDFEVENGIARRADRVLAGSTVSMLGAVRNLVALGARLEDALAAASAAPARIAGRPELGTLAPGSVADVVVLDDGLEVVRVLVDGADALA